MYLKSMESAGPSISVHDFADPPAKRARLSPEQEPSSTMSALDVAGSPGPVDDMDDDLYETPTAPQTHQISQLEHDHMGDDTTAIARSQEPDSTENHQGGIPGLGLLKSPDVEPVSDDKKHPVDTGADIMDLVQGPGAEATTQPSTSDTMEAVEPAPEAYDGAMPDAQTLESQFLEAAVANKGNAEAEWELDSSPAESSSSDDSSSDSSSSDDSDDDDEEEGYELLSPEEQARILMQGDGGSDDEGGPGKTGKPGAALLRTKNETEERIEKPDVQLQVDDKIEELGAVEAIVEATLLIKANVSGEYQVLESGSVLCLEDRTVIGAVAETLGRVQQPLYSVRFNSDEEIAAAGVSKGTRVFYAAKHSTYVFTKPLQALKGSDASNIHDEEVGEDEIEFSDDEAEAEYKRKLKLERQARKAERSGGASGPNTSRQHPPSGLRNTDTLNYEDGETDELYTPLARPTNLSEMMAHPPPLETRGFRGPPQRGGGRGGRDRGHRGWDHRGGRGGRGGGIQPGGREDGHQGGYDQQRPQSSSSPQNGYGWNPIASQSPSSNGPSQFNPPQQQQFQWPQHPNQQPQHSYSPQQQQQPFPFFPHQQQQQPPQPHNGGALPPGSFVNPAFFQARPQAQQQQFPAAAAAALQNNPALAQWVQAYQNSLAAGQGAAPPANGAGASPGESSGAYQAAQQTLDILRGLNRPS